MTLFSYTIFVHAGEHGLARSVGQVSSQDHACNFHFGWWAITNWIKRRKNLELRLGTCSAGLKNTIPADCCERKILFWQDVNSNFMSGGTSQPAGFKPAEHALDLASASLNQWPSRAAGEVVDSWMLCSGAFFIFRQCTFFTKHLFAMEPVNTEATAPWPPRAIQTEN